MGTAVQRQPCFACLGILCALPVYMGVGPHVVVQGDKDYVAVIEG